MLEMNRNQTVVQGKALKEGIHKTTGKYLLYAFGISWGAWGLVILGITLGWWQFGNPIAMSCYVLGGVAPGIAAILAKRQEGSKEVYKDFLKNIVDFKKTLSGYALAMLTPMCLTALIVLVGGAKLTQPLYMGFVLIIPMIIGGGLEEIGWRGLLQPALEKHFSVLSSTMIITGIWAVWHLPLWFIPWTSQSTTSFLFFIVMVLVFALLLSSVYYKTQSTFLCILCHATINAFWGLVQTNGRIVPLIPCVIFGLVVLMLTIKARKKKEMK